MRLHHVGIFVKKITDFEKSFSHKFQTVSCSKLILDKNLGVKIKFIKFEKSNQLFEIVEPYGNKNPVTKVLRNKLNIINHIAFFSNDFINDVNNLVKKNFYPITCILKSKYFNSDIVFLMSPQNFIIEIIKNDNNRKIKRKR